MYFFEYLLFKVIDIFESGEFFCVVVENGGSDNVFISYDYIVYY